tara:strand:- start:785 stop:1375 length:591 start_codon:yes stop_codon:yes gene_type:complete
MPLEEYTAKIDARKSRLKEALAEVLEGNELPLCLEIGSGHGHWMVDFASVHSDRFCLGVDIMGKRIRKSNQKLERAALSNAAFIQGEAFETLDSLPEGMALKEAFILFPDPWPKKRHWKNRIINPQFLSSLAQRCAAGVRVYFRTDVFDYYEWALEVVGEHQDWDILESAEWPFERETIFQGKAESYNSLVFARSE